MKMMKIEGWQQPVAVKRGTLLEAGLSAGLPIPNQCRTGECGSCKCRLLDGDVERLQHLPDALSPKEEAEGHILACRSKALTDLRIAFPQPLGPPVVRPGRHVAKVAKITRLTSDVVQMSLRLKQPLAFHAGQYWDVTLPGQPTRSYSPANAPGGETLDFYVKVRPDGRVSTAIANRLKPGVSVRLKGPYGSACLPGQPEQPVILAAGGTGIAPILSMARHLDRIVSKVPISLYFGVRAQQGLFALDELEALCLPNLSLNMVLSEQTGQHRHGFIAPAIAEDHASLANHLVFCAGPPVMVESVEAQARQIGADPSCIFADKFVEAAPDRPRLLGGLFGDLRRRLAAG